MNDAPNNRVSARVRLSLTPAAVATPQPIEQTTAHVDTDELHLRMRAQSLATKGGKAAPFPSIEEARALLAALDAPQQPEETAHG